MPPLMKLSFRQAEREGQIKADTESGERQEAKGLRIAFFLLGALRQLSPAFGHLQQQILFRNIFSFTRKPQALGGVVPVLIHIRHKVVPLLRTNAPDNSSRYQAVPSGLDI
jgi:hypothetical protein